VMENHFLRLDRFRHESSLRNQYLRRIPEVHLGQEVNLPPISR